jgi:hypothetical protein
MAVVSTPLLSPPPAGRKSPMKKRVAIAVAAVAALAAIATIAGAVGQWQLNARRAMLVQAQIAAATAQEVPVMAQPVYYVPLSAAQGAAAPTQQALAQPRPVVYYYVPESSLKTPHAAVQLADNATAPAAGAAGGNATGAAPAFSCKKDNLLAVAKKVLPLWAACSTAPDYKEPNKDAKRRLLDLSSEAQAYWSKLADANASAPAAGAAKAPTLAECETKALGNTCADIAGCPNPVCSSYYNDADIEALCGVCTMKVNMWFGCFARDATVSSYVS